MPSLCSLESQHKPVVRGQPLSHGCIFIWLHSPVLLALQFFENKVLEGGLWPLWAFMGVEKAFCIRMAACS